MFKDKNTFLLSVFVCSLWITLTVQHDIVYLISKTYPHSSKSQIKLGKLVVTTQLQYKQITSYVDPDYPSLISQNDFQHGDTVVLTFTELGHAGHVGKSFKSAISIETYQKSKTSSSSDVNNGIEQPQRPSRNPNIFHENILVYVDNNDLSIKAINYVQERATSKESTSQMGISILSQVIKMERGREEIFKFVPIQQASEQPQDQSFFSKYKWPLIIVGVIMYLTSTMDKGQGQQQGQGQAQGAARTA